MAMSEADELPMGWQRTMPATDPEALYVGVAEALDEGGFQISETRPSSDDGTVSALSLVGIRETVLDARGRFWGKVALASAIVMVGITLVLVVSGEERRFILEWLLTIEVIVGGVALTRFKDPPKVLRRVVEVRFEGGAGDTHLSVREGVGRVDEGRSGWYADADPEFGEERADEFSRRARAVAAEPPEAPSER
jgi:hypothetical protein